MKPRALTLFTCLLLAAGCSSGQRPSGNPPPHPAPAGTPTPDPLPKPAPPVARQPVLHELNSGALSFKVEAALTSAQRLQGLSGRKDLPADQGMLFVYRTSDVRRFWMKDCLIALDIAWLDENGKILSIDTLDPPSSAAKEDDLKRSTSPSPSRYVLEMRAQWFKDHQLAVGSTIRIPASLAAAASE